LKKQIIDTSGWIEYFSGGKKAKAYRKHITSGKDILTPTLILYEIYKKIRLLQSQFDSVFAITQIQNFSSEIVPLDESLALKAADISILKKLSMADSIIYATTLKCEATLVTSDHHFEGMEQITLI
jgi:predicted nucleic acid-binding protein